MPCSGPVRSHTWAHQRGRRSKIRGYTITIPRDGVCGFEGVDENDALAYLEMAYGATITTVDELAEAPAPAHVGG